MPSPSRCAICREAMHGFRYEGGHYDCPRCGRYSVDSDALEDYLGPPTQPIERVRHLVMAETRTAKQPMRLTCEYFRRVLTPPPPERDVEQKMEAMLRWVKQQSRSTGFGTDVEWSGNRDHPVAWCVSSDETERLRQALAKQGLIESRAGDCAYRVMWTAVPASCGQPRSVS